MIAPEEDLSTLNITPREVNALRRAKVTAVTQLEKMTDADILNIHNIGMTGLNRIKKALNKIPHTPRDVASEGYTDARRASENPNRHFAIPTYASLDLQHAWQIGWDLGKAHLKEYDEMISKWETEK